MWRSRSWLYSVDLIAMKISRMAHNSHSLGILFLHKCKSLILLWIRPECHFQNVKIPFLGSLQNRINKNISLQTLETNETNQTFLSVAICSYYYIGIVCIFDKEIYWYIQILWIHYAVNVWMVIYLVLMRDSFSTGARIGCRWRSLDCARLHKVDWVLISLTFKQSFWL